MNTFKRKALFTAVLAGLGAAGTAEAVYLNPNSAGQVLVYPYYTVQSAGGNAFNTYLSVVNTTSRAKAVKVRVLEGKTSAEVLDFNLFLSPNDMWTAAIVPADATAGSVARMLTADLSCTNPVGNLPIANGGEPFRNFQYSTGGDALPGTGLDRTREGYVEIIEMGTLTGAWATAVTHVSGVPANCAVVRGATLTPSSIEAPTGGLVGTGVLINVNSGADAGYKADALEAYRSASIYSDAGQIFPSLADAAPPRSVVINAGGIDPVTGASTLITAYRSTFATTSGVADGARAVASVYMHTAVINEYILDTATASLTDWVITQPLKRVFVTNTAAAQPYTNVLTSSGACETIGFTFFDREERSATASTGDFSPLPPAGSPNSLCWESNVLSIRNGAAHMPAATTPPTSGVLGSLNVTNVNVTPSFQNGWGRLTFTNTGALAGMGSTVSDRTSMGGITSTTVAGAPATFFGLPVTGFMIRTLRNGNLTCGTATCQGNYGSLFNHSYVTTIAP